MSRTILVIGASAWDRLVFVSAFPEPDSKIRSTAYFEGGGGNAANTAHALALLSKNNGVAVQLASTIGADAVGQQVRDELETAGVILGDLFVKGPPNSTTSFTTILVDQMALTRTCIFTYGSCGELSIDHVAQQSVDEMFQQVQHFHSDSRHTDVALYLAREARRRGIPISMDVEKDRHSQALDELLPLVDIVFTNALQIKDYLERLHTEKSMQRLSSTGREYAAPKVSPDHVHWSSADGLGDHRRQPDAKLTNFLAHVLHPSIFLACWYPQIGQQVIITKGALGAVHVHCTDIITSSSTTAESEESLSKSSVTESTLTLSQLSNNLQEYKATYTYTTENPQPATNDPSLIETEIITFTITLTGVSSDVKLPIGDPTGAGDAFVAGYLTALYSFSYSSATWTTLTKLQFAAWVAGKKLRGPGARSSLPTEAQVYQALGPNPQQISMSLSKLVKPMLLDAL